MKTAWGDPRLVQIGYLAIFLATITFIGDFGLTALQGCVLLVVALSRNSVPLEYVALMV